MKVKAPSTLYTHIYARASFELIFDKSPKKLVTFVASAAPKQLFYFFSERKADAPDLQQTDINYIQRYTHKESLYIRGKL
jgi:hypothetical protein